MRYFALVVIVIFNAIQIEAQTVITLEKAVSMGIENNKELLKAEKELQKSEFTYREALSRAKPQINSNITYMRNLYSSRIPNMAHILTETGNQIIDINNRLLQMGGMEGNIPIMPLPDQEIRAVPYNTFSMGVDVTQPLYTGGKVGTALLIARDFRSMSELSYQVKRNETVFNIKKAFYNVLVAKKAIEVLETVKENASNNLKNAEMMFEQGLVSEHDIVRARVQVHAVQPRLVEMQNNYEMAKSLLQIEMGLNSTEEITVSGTLEIGEPVEIGNIEELVTQNRKELQVLEYVRDISEKNVKIESGNRLPVLAAFASYQYRGQHNDFGELFNGVHAVNVGLNLTVPIYTGGRVSARTYSAYNSMHQAELDLQKTTRLLVLQAQQAKKRISQTHEELELNRLTVTQAEKSLEIANVRYANNLSTQLEVFDAETALEQAKMQYISSIHRYITAKLEYQHAIGSLRYGN